MLSGDILYAFICLVLVCVAPFETGGRARELRSQSAGDGGGIWAQVGETVGCVPRLHFGIRLSFFNSKSRTLRKVVVALKRCLHLITIKNDELNYVRITY